MISIPAALLALSAAASAVFVPRSGYQNISSIFESGLSSGASIYYPSDPDFDIDTTPRWSTFAEPSFVVTIKPATNEDVQNIVKIANRHNISFYATGGAHGAEPGFANVKNSVNIDLGNFDKLIVDPQANILTVGANITFSQIFEPLYNVSKELPVGNAPCVNLVGATIGAGVGPLQGLHGVILDSLRSVRLITANGELLNASQTEHADLFWAIRGAGANFGIITEAVYEIYNATNHGQVIDGDFEFDPAANHSLWEVIKSFDTEFPKQAGITIGAGFNHTSGQPTLGAIVTFFGTQEEAQPFLDKFIALDPILWRNISVPWPELDTVAGFGNGAHACPRGTYATHYGVGSNRTDVATFAKIYADFAEYALTRPWYTGSMAIQRFGAKKSLELPKKDQGAYPWRDIKLLIEFNNFYDNFTHDSDVDTFCKAKRAEFQEVSGFPSPHIYVNYAFGDEGPEAWYGPSLPRLTELKQKWDPDNKFGPGNPIISNMTWAQF